MRVFVTGATGFIGSAIVQDLIAAGHEVLGLARNDASADALARLGVQAHRGDLTDVASLVAAARACDGVIHTAYIHDFSNIAASGVVDTKAVEAIGDALADSGRPFLTTSGIAVLPPGSAGTEEEAGDPNSVGKHRVASEEATLALAKRGVRASVVRLPPSVHDAGDHGFVPALIAAARQSGVSAYIAEGNNRWPAVHRLDAARLFRLALEKGAAGSRFHAIGDDGIPTRAIAEVIGQRLGVPVVSKSPAEAAEHFGWLGHFFALDCPASAEKTKAQLGWEPTHPGLLEDLEGDSYFSRNASSNDSASS
ncbi:MAG: SDR family oxidoreductase [Acidobacteria bacterium]|nr:SDR family oxidoreductase [Acidobacteriota bacterium]